MTLAPLRDPATGDPLWPTALPPARVARALIITRGNVAAAARLCGVPAGTLRAWIREQGWAPVVEAARGTAAR